MLTRLIHLVLAMALVSVPGYLQAQPAAATITDSLNNNNVYLGDMTNAWQNQYQYTHQFDHQINFDSAFQGARDVTVMMPISNIHLQQSNTGVTVGAQAGAVANGTAQMNLTESTLNGMVGLNLNLGGAATNQLNLNVVTAFGSGK